MALWSVNYLLILKHFYFFQKEDFFMLGSNIPVVKLGIIAVSRDCFPIALSTQRRKNFVEAY
jgi:hypothetical protein